jgi:hypothetical protein
MSGFLCSMVGATFTVAAVAQVLRAKTGISANGNAQVSTAQSQFGGSSLLLDGTGDWLETTGVNISRSDNFTCEAWIRLAALPGTGSFSMLLSGVGGGEQYMSIKNISGTYVSDIVVNNGSTIREEDYTISSISTNTWYHWAIVKNGSTITHYFNGTALTTLYASSGTMSSGHGFNAINKIGVYSNNSLGWNGYIDEIRISNSARYTANFTPSTIPFVNDANTLFLMHANGTNASTFFEDDNGVRASNGLSQQNTATISTTQSYFGGSSLSLNGSSSVTTPTSFAFGTTDFTVEYWVRSTTLSGYDIHWDLRGGDTSQISPIVYTLDGQLTLDVGATTRITGSTLSTNTWYHIALSRSGSSTKLFINGTQTGSTYTDTNNYLAATPLYIGTSGSNGVNGFMDEFRISNSARYTTTFTPSTTPFVNDANTLLLCHFNGTNASTVFLDDNGTGRSQNNGRRNSSAVISTTRSKFGASSVYLPSDYVTFANAIEFPDNQDFTWEFWVNEDVVQNCKYIGGQTAGDIFIGHDSYGNETYNNRLAVGVVAVGWYMDFGVTLAADTWYHVCVQRSGDTVYGYTDGTLRVTHTGYLANYDWTWRNLQLSGERDGGTVMNGYQDEIRFSNIVRYATAGFTAPTASFQNDANTVLLIHGDGSNNSTVFTDDNGIAPYTP